MKEGLVKVCAQHALNVIFIYNFCDSGYHKL